MPAQSNRSSATALTALGATFVVAGGVLAAVTGPLQLSFGSWLAAYAVLVAGVGQVAMGLARLSSTDSCHGWWQLTAWNLGNALVVTGTLIAQPALVSGGGLVLLAALVLALSQSRLLPRHPLSWSYRAILIVLAVSIPVGLTLSFLRHGG